jgi:hypothetical protein
MAKWRERLASLFPAGACLAAGVALALIAIFDPRESAFPAGRGPVFLAALVFGLAGVALGVNQVQSRYKPALQTLFGTLLLAGFAGLSACMTLGSPIGMLFSLAPCLFMTGLGVWATVRDFRAAWREASREKERAQ